MRKASLQVTADSFVVTQEIASPNQKVEKVELTAAFFQPFVLRDAVTEFGRQQSRKIGVGLHSKQLQRIDKDAVCGDYLVSRNFFSIAGGPLAIDFEIPGPPQVDQPCFESVVIPCPAFLN